MDANLSRAKELHRQAQACTAQADQFRQRRDDIIVRLYERGKYSHMQLASAIGCSPELIAKILRLRRVPKSEASTGRTLKGC